MRSLLLTHPNKSKQQPSSTDLFWGFSAAKVKILFGCKIIFVFIFNAISAQKITKRGYSSFNHFIVC